MKLNISTRLLKNQNKYPHTEILSKESAWLKVSHEQNYMEGTEGRNTIKLSKFSYNILKWAWLNLLLERSSRYSHDEHRGLATSFGLPQWVGGPNKYYLT